VPAAARDGPREEHPAAAHHGDVGAGVAVVDDHHVVLGGGRTSVGCELPGDARVGGRRGDDTVRLDLLAGRDLEEPLDAIAHRRGGKDAHPRRRGARRRPGDSSAPRAGASLGSVS